MAPTLLSCLNSHPSVYTCRGQTAYLPFPKCIFSGRVFHSTFLSFQLLIAFSVPPSSMFPPSTIAEGLPWFSFVIPSPPSKPHPTARIKNSSLTDRTDFLNFFSNIISPLHLSPETLPPTKSILRFPAPCYGFILEEAWKLCYTLWSFSF